MKHVVAIGGGTGLYALLGGLKQFPLDITSVVTMMDDGGSSGRLIDEFGVLPPGDIRRSLVALSEETPVMKELFQYRFKKGEGLNGHSFGNLLLTALHEITKSDASAIETAAKLLKIKGTVLPVTLKRSTLVATLQNGRKLRGQATITQFEHDPPLQIARLETLPPVSTTPAVKHAIGRADLIVIGPGDLYTSILANFLARGLVQAVRRSKAKVAYVVNVMTKPSETPSFSVRDHTAKIVEVLGPGVLDSVLYNTRRPPEALAIKYRRQNQEMVVLRSGEAQWFAHRKIKLIGAPLLKPPILARHNSVALAKQILALL